MSQAAANTRPKVIIRHCESYDAEVIRGIVREAMEETGLHVTLETLFYVYSDPRRDPRKHTLSTVFTARASGEPIGMDDAEEARIFSLDALPDTMAFDHAEILRDYTRFIETGVRPSPVDR